MRLIAIALLASGCASADTIRPFPLNPIYQEHIADPGVVNKACYQDRGHLDDGTLKGWNDSYCGCVDIAFSVVWIARHIDCDREQVEKHENCHIETGFSREARAECARKFT